MPIHQFGRWALYSFYHVFSLKWKELRFDVRKRCFFILERKILDDGML